MGLPARRETVDSRTERSARPQLRVVLPARRSAPKRNSAAYEDRCRRAFRVVLVGMIALSVCGLGRVALSAKANEASIDASALRTDIKNEQLTADRLEVDKSCLMTPSRIEAIAGTTMRMSEADDVTFITISDVDETASDAQGALASNDVATDVADASLGADKGKAEQTPLRALLTSVMDMAAGEAQVLLVGDIGLASSR
ncbi:MAG: hypothetical protein PF636_05810 [Actinomycetota bacterium]|jgi:cell division protein FtsL|nr:hypothetical protein [Actinomycetota bacterium]